jgi:hypothetical protein
MTESDATRIAERMKSVEELEERHRTVGAALFEKCGRNLFPCDQLAMVVLDRSLNTVAGFVLLLKNHGYICGVALLRMQLDNILRFHGVVKSGDAHGAASSVSSGTQLRKLKDSRGRKMTDAILVDHLQERNPGVADIYNKCSGYIHLSDEHFLHFLARCGRDNEGRRLIAIGNNDDHLSLEHRYSLIDAFAVVTRGVLEAVSQWTLVRDQHGDFDTLSQRFSPAP